MLSDTTGTLASGPDGLLTGSPARLAADRRRARRQGLLLAPVLMILGAAGALWLAAQGGGQIEVIALAAPVERGQIVAETDLAVVRLSAEGGQVRLATPATAQRDLVGKAALVDMPAGTLLTPEMVAAGTPGSAGVAVGVRVAADAMPAPVLRSGEWVQVVGTDPAAGQATVLAPSVEVLSVAPATTEATGGRADTVVYLSVPPESAAQVAAAAATDNGVRLLGVRP
jgi:hypothetical protein